MTDYDAEFNMLVIKLGGLIKDFPIVKKFENQKKSTNSQVLEKHIEVGRSYIGYTTNCKKDYWRDYI